MSANFLSPTGAPRSASNLPRPASFAAGGSALLLGVLVLGLTSAPGAARAGAGTPAATAPTPAPALVGSVAEPAAALESARRRAVAPGALAARPFHFEPNRGQLDPEVQWFGRGAGYDLFLTAGAAVFALHRPGGREVVRMRLQGADAQAAFRAREPLGGQSHYLRGRDPAAWVRGVPHHRRVLREGVYPGVDLAWYGHPGRALEYDFIVQPGVDPGVIRLVFEGVDALAVDAAGALVLRAGDTVLRQRPPVAYQAMPGAGGAERRAVPARFVVEGTHSVRFALAAYDTTRALVIDPVLEYATHLGGSGDETARAVAVDTAGNAYVTGVTTSLDFPATAGAHTVAAPGDADAFVAKLDPTGSSVVWATYLGGPGEDEANGIAVDAAGHAFVTGGAHADFPTTGNAFRTEPVGGMDAFVVKLSAAGDALFYATFFGSENFDRGRAIAVDDAGHAYVTGVVGGLLSRPFDVTPGAFQETAASSTEAFVTKLAPDGASLVFSTLLGGPKPTGGEYPSDREIGQGIAVDAYGHVYVGGVTQSRAFPTTGGAFQEEGNGALCDLGMIDVHCDGGFLAKLNAAGSALVWSTYLAPFDGFAEITALAVDAAGEVVVTGHTTHPGFPVTPGAFDESCGSDGACDLVPGPNLLYSDAFVTRFAASGAQLVYSSFLGGASHDQGHALALDDIGNAYVAGFTQSGDFPVSAGAPQALNAGSSDAFLVRLDPGGTRLDHGTLLGGALDERATAIAVDRAGEVLVAGHSGSSDFPSTAGSAQPASAGGDDAVLARYRTGRKALCDLGLSERGYTSGEDVTLARNRLANLSGAPLAYELKRWTREPGGAVTVTQNVGGDGQSSWPAGYDVDTGASTLLSVSAATPRGWWEVGCTVLDPGSGERLAEYSGRFEVR